MIPEGTSPEAIIIVVVGTTLVGCGLMVALFWYRFPNMHKGIVNLFRVFVPRPQPRADGRTGTDERTDEVSVADRWLDRLELDRTRTTVIDILLYSGWTITDLRREKILRGENAEISAEVEAARKRLGMVPSAEYRTPVAGRSTDAKFQEVL